MPEMMMAQRLYTADSLEHAKVYNLRGEKLGEIEDIVIDPARGCVAYAVLDVDRGWFGRDKYFAVPWQAMQIDEAHRSFILDIDKGTLDQMPGFDHNQWPTEPDDIFASKVHEEYGYAYPPRQETRPYQQGQQQMGSQQQMGGMGGDEQSYSTRGEGSEQSYPTQQGYGTQQGYETREGYGQENVEKKDERTGNLFGLGRDEDEDPNVKR